MCVRDMECLDDYHAYGMTDSNDLISQHKRESPTLRIVSAFNFFFFFLNDPPPTEFPPLPLPASLPIPGGASPGCLRFGVGKNPRGRPPRVGPASSFPPRASAGPAAASPSPPQRAVAKHGSNSTAS